MTQIVDDIELIVETPGWLAGETDGVQHARILSQPYRTLKAIDRAAQVALRAARSRQPTLVPDEYLAGWIFGYEDTLLTARLRVSYKNRQEGSLS